ncbi:hypothetical protein C8J57DRAFT_1256648 [Mycena rebaudengoi]|nr:hypothetical protein C8J57DRAFT_1256648 [Mycena rebaudengoi]
MEGEARKGGAQFVSARGMRRRQRHLHAGRGRRSAVGQHTWHVTKATTLTIWKGKGERSLSAHAACDEGDDTYFLEGEGGAQFVKSHCMRQRRRHILPGRGRGAQLVSAGGMRRRRRHLHAGRGRRSAARQRRQHATKATTLTRWKGKEERSLSAHAACDKGDDTYVLEGKEEHSLSAHAACDEGNDTYTLEGEGGAQFVSACGMRRRRRHLLPGRGRGGTFCQRTRHATKATTLTSWKGKGGHILSAHAACDEGNDTYTLEGEGRAQFVSARGMRQRGRHLHAGRGRRSTVFQRTRHATKATTLTRWKGKEERSLSAHAACDEGDDTYGLEGEGGAHFVSARGMRQKERHLRPERGRRSAAHQRRRHATNAMTLTSWQGKEERSSSAQAACDECDDTYELEGEGGAQLISARCVRRRQRHLLPGRGRGSAARQGALRATNATTLTGWKGEGEHILSVHTACDECDDTYGLEGEGGAHFGEERSLSAHAACDEGDDTYALEREGERSLSACAACNGSAKTHRC